MNSQQQDVTTFHEIFGHPAPAFPAESLTPELEAHFRKRAKWLHEEADELEEACDVKDLVAALDALIDSQYFAVGGFVVAGHDQQPFWDNVQAANMDKLDPVTKLPVVNPEDGKIGKREGWTPPEARHEETLAAAIATARMESAARQLAWLQLTNPAGTISIPDGHFTAASLGTVMARAKDILDEGDKYVERLYRELEQHQREQGLA